MSKETRTQTVITIRKDIFDIGTEEQHTIGQRKQRRGAHRAIAEALSFLSLEHASFAFADNKKSDEIKEAIRLWASAWVVPALEEAFDKSAPRK